ncbi:MAG: hypothetical protein M3340_02375 [Actinomycetota bacterium]|nr:hypothetical protein [Actinomycetota bacterium]
MWSAPIVAVAAWFVLVVVVLRAAALVHHADEDADRHWEELGRMRSESGIPFFPTRRSRRELEVAISDLIRLAL